MTSEALSPHLTRRQLLAGTMGIGLSSWSAWLSEPDVFHTRAHRGPSAATENPAARIAVMPDRELAARLFMAPIAGIALTAEEDVWLRLLKPGGVILTFQNFGSTAEVEALVAAIHATNPEWPPLVALDQEGGLVWRIADDPAPDAPTLGALSAAEIAHFARLRAETLASYGFDLNFAPVADVANVPDSAMAGRTFGSDPELVAEAVAAYFAGVAGTGVLHCAKHFPGHGRVTVDSHLALPVLDIDPDRWWETDALPFRAAVAAGAPAIMLGHLVVPAWDALPASISTAAVQVLRGDLGFTGVVVSDDLGMGALAEWGAFDVVDLAVTAGVDLLLYVSLTAPLESLVDHLVAQMDLHDDMRDHVIASVERLLRLRS